MAEFKGEFALGADGGKSPAKEASDQCRGPAHCLPQVSESSFRDSIGRLDLPIFRGRDLTEWIFRIERYFKAVLTDLSDDLLKGMFIDGLKMTLRVEVCLIASSNLGQAMTVAQWIEDKDNVVSSPRGRPPLISTDMEWTVHVQMDSAWPIGPSCSCLKFKSAA
ncbi:hypothetical protein H6P81_013965 [Aristolochia fimbriata]|uniref:Uncharacterized protein n=1 Tax=Aristolochia fimbriata TaxID=158543 RepID=A0AAV7EJT6_ARIFI|nr:hypothetical protein H6P81_013965 [Aristolochia fimbriata]